MKHIFVVNPLAGRGKALQLVKEGIATLRGVDTELYCTTGPGDATAFVAQRSQVGDPVRFYACGGDGSLNEVVNGAAGHDHVQISCFPCGSGNDFVKYYGGAQRFSDMQALVAAEAKPIDLIRAEGKYSINAFHFGFDSYVAGEMTKLRHKKFIGGRNAYPVSVVKGLIHAMKTQCRIVVDNEELLDGEMLLCTIANGSHVGGSYRCAPRSDNADGLLEVCLVLPVSRPLFLQLMGRYREGKHLDDPKFAPYIRYRRAKKILVEGKEGFKVSFDGEVVEGTRFSVEVLPGAIPFAYPE